MPSTWRFLKSVLSEFLLDGPSRGWKALTTKDENHDDSVMFSMFFSSMTCKTFMLNVSVISFNPQKSCLKLSIMISKIDTLEFAPFVEWIMIICVSQIIIYFVESVMLVHHIISSFEYFNTGETTLSKTINNCSHFLTFLGEGSKNKYITYYATRIMKKNHAI